MPNLTALPAWARRLARVLLAVGYLSIAVVGAIGLTWPDGTDLTPWAQIVTRVGGGMMLVGGLAACATVWYRWLIELNALPLIGAGMAAYGWVLLTLAGPTRWTLILLGCLTALFAVLASRGVVLTTRLETRLRARHAATGQTGGR